MAEQKKYSISGQIKLTLPDDVIELNNFKIEAYSPKQALFKTALDLASKGSLGKMSPKYLYKRMLKSKMKVVEIR